MGQVSDFTHDFDPTSSNSCAPISVSFTNASTGASTYEWTINGISFSTSASPRRSFALGGTFNVCLTASNGTGSDLSCQVLNISQPADIQITNTPAAGCTPYVSSIDISASEVITNATIDFGDGVIDVISPNAATFSASHTYVQEGTYSVTVSVIDANGCSSTTSSSNLFTIRNVKNLGFGISLSDCQIPLTATFINTSANASNYSFDWDYGDGSTDSNITNTSHAYTIPDAYDVAMTATDNLTGCSDTYVIVDAVSSSSVTTITATEVNNGTCSAKEIDFTLENLPLDATVTWDFGDNLMSGGPSTTHVYTTAGCFTPTAEITTTSNCKYTISYGSCITSIGPNDPSISLTGDLETCNPTVGTTVQHSSNSTNAISWNWDFGDGNSSTQENPSHTYTGYGSYQPILTTNYADGCVEVYTNPAQSVVIQDPALSITVDTARGCIPFDVNFSISGANDPIASIDWNFGAGATPVSITDNSPMVTFGTVGDYDISATVTTTSGCSYMVNAVGLIEVGDIPNVNFAVDTLASCVDSPVMFTDLSDATVDEWEWNFGDGTSTEQHPTHQFSESDSFQVNLKAWYNGCPAEFLDTNYIKIGDPKAEFSWNFDCNNLNTIDFTDLSTGADSIWWDFGDGSAMEDTTNPKHLFPGEGTYTVTQFTKNHTTGCIDDRSITINLVNPVAQFDLRDTTFCKDDIITITNLSSNIHNISWDILSVDPGDYQVINAGSNGSDARIRFLQTNKPYTDFVLNYSIDPGCAANRSITYNNTVTIHSIFPGFTHSVDGCLPATISVDRSFEDLLTVPFNDPTVEYFWQFDSHNGYGDSTYTGANPTIIADKVGLYDINLRMTNGAGCDLSIVTPVNILIDTTVIDFDWQMINCDTREIEFVNTSFSSTATSYEWDFGDGSTSNASTTSHQYAANGDYDVRFIVHTSNGCSDTLIQTIQVYDPIAEFAGDNITKSCPNPALITNFTNNSTGGSSYEWFFGDGGTSTLMNPAHAFSQVDSFDITLIATSVNGCTDTISKLDYIQVGGPFAELEYSTIESCTGSDIQFIVKGDGVTEYTWDFGDGNALTSVPTAANDTITFAYAVPGRYQPVLIAEDLSGCRIPYIGADSIQIFDLTIDFTADTLVMCSNSLVDVNFTSQISNQTAIDSIRWFFPGSNTPSALGATVSGVGYSATNQYDVTMIAYTSVCADTLVKTAYIEVFDPPTFTAPADVSICNGSSVQLDITDGAGLIWSWDNSASLSCDDCPNPIANPTTTTTYTITGTSLGGCSMTRTVTVTVDEPNVAYITTPNISICVGRDVPINIPANASNLVWTTSSQTLACTDCNNQVITINGSGTVDVAYDYLSCRITETLVIDAWDPATIDESASTQSICPGDAISLDRPAYPGIIEWRVDDINSTPLSGTTYNPTADTRFYISVEYYGCTAIDSFDVTIDQPSIAISPDVTICLGDSTQLIANGGPSYSYQWDIASLNLSCYDCPNPYASPTTTTTYQVTADNGNGCKATETVTVTVNDITSDILPDTMYVCLGAIETLTLPNTVSNVAWTSTLALSQANGLTTDVTASTSADVQVSYVRDFCTIEETVHIKVWDPSTVDAGPDAIVCQGDAVILATNYPGSITWREGSLTATPIVGNQSNPTSPTRYYLEVMHHGCTAVDSFDITLDLPTVTASADVTICLGESVPLTVSGDANINTYVWDNSVPGLSCYPCFDPVATPNVTSSYIVVATNTNGCSARDTVVVTVNDSIPNFLTDTVNVCVDDIVPFSLSGVTNVSWVSSLTITTSNGDLDANITASDSNFVDVTYDWNTCTYTERIIFQPWDSTSVNAGIDQLVCEGQQVVLPLSPFGTTIWRAGSPTATPLATNIINPTVPTTYYMEVNYNGCTGNDDVFIDIDLPMINTSGDITICIGESTPLSVMGDAGNTYVWTPSFGLDNTTSATPSANPSSTTKYIVTGTNLNGCSVSDSLIVTVNDPQSDILGDTIKICLNAQDTINIVPLAGTTNIQWSTNITGAAFSCISCIDPIFTAADTGTITLTYEYQACLFTETIYVDTWDPSSLYAGADELICVGDTVSLNTNYDGIVEWREGSLSNPALFQTDVHPENSTWYYLSVTRYGCTGVDSLQIRLNKPTLEVDQPDPICVGTTIPLFVRGVSDPSMTFQWDGSQPGLSCLDCDNPDATPPFTSTYTVTGTNSFGCTVEEDVTVQVDQDTIDLMPDTIYACINSTFDIILDIANNPGVDTTRIFWATSIPIDCQCYHPQLSVDQSGPMTLNYRYNSCNKIEEIYVVAWDPATVDAGPDQTICAGEEIQLDRNYPGNVQWYFDDMNTTSLTGGSDIPTQSGRYYLRVDNYGCFGIDSMDVVVLPNADISGGHYEICEGDSVQVDVVGSADSILFNNAGSISDPGSFSPWASPTITTTYTVVGKNNGCALDTATIEVVVNPNPVIDMRLPAEFIEGDQIRLQAEVNATDNLSYIWTPGDMIDCTSCQLPLFTPTATTMVSLTVTDDDTGCMAVDTATITQKFICSDNSIGMASAFSPNNDGVNDHIIPVSLNEITAFKVFNRWGELVFQSDGSGLGWDGVYNGTALKRGVYVWIAEGVCRFDGRILTAKGDFMLIR